jgi:hypothetical protein
MNKKENLFLPLLKAYFPSSKKFRRSELRDFFRKQEAELTDQAFRRKLYALEKKKIIRQTDRGTYCLDDVKLEDAQTISPVRKKYIPTMSPEIRALSILLLTNFPYTVYLVWETKILHEFMLHQPGQSQIILEVEKEASESVFNFLASHYPGKIFLEPTQPVFERYVLNSPDSILVSRLISRSPMQKVKGIPCPKIEKILVDIFADEEKFLAFHGQELVYIYENAFQTYLVSEKTLFWYAERRKVHSKIRTFIIQNTSIQLKSQ